jgi:hypothetical protein
MTSYGGVDTLDEPVTATIVRLPKASFPLMLWSQLASRAHRAAICNPFTTSWYRCCILYAKVLVGRYSGAWLSVGVASAVRLITPFPGTGISGDRSSYV